MESFITDNDQEKAMTAIKKIVSIPSYLQEKEEGAPFGSDICHCLDETLNLFANEGFTTYVDPEGYYGYAEIGEGDQTLAILCHLDVVPAGDLSQWETEPFQAEVADGKIIGRGTQDDKGPTLATLYALKAVLNKGYQLNKKIRFIFGTDEENLWRCMAKYNEKEEAADMGFAPDADFPVIYAEKGLTQCYAEGPAVSGYTFRGGDALNVVPDQATYEGDRALEIAKELEKLGYAFELNEPNQVVVYGKAVHSKDAPEGVNAIMCLAQAMAPFYDDPAVQLLGHVLTDNGHATELFGQVADEASGELTVNFATISSDENGTTIGIDLREPVTIDHEALMTTLSNALQDNGLVYRYFDYVAPLYVPKDSELVQTLTQVYHDISGENDEPMVSGGATFARTMKNCVAFGAMFKDTVTLEHQPNEAWNLAEMRRAMEIYAEAFYRLCVK